MKQSLNMIKMSYDTECPGCNMCFLDTHIIIHANMAPREVKACRSCDYINWSTLELSGK